MAITSGAGFKERYRLALRIQTINHGVFPETDIAAQAVGHGDENPAVGREYRRICCPKGREFLDHHQLSPLPLIEAGYKIGFRSRRRAVNEIDLDEMESAIRLS